MEVELFSQGLDRRLDRLAGQLLAPGKRFAPALLDVLEQLVAPAAQPLVLTPGRGQSQPGEQSKPEPAAPAGERPVGAEVPPPVPPLPARGRGLPPRPAPPAAPGGAPRRATPPTGRRACGRLPPGAARPFPRPEDAPPRPGARPLHALRRPAGSAPAWPSRPPSSRPLSLACRTGRPRAADPPPSDSRTRKRHANLPSPPAADVVNNLPAALPWGG